MKLKFKNPQHLGAAVASVLAVFASFHFLTADQAAAVSSAVAGLAALFVSNTQEGNS